MKQNMNTLLFAPSPVVRILWNLVLKYPLTDIGTDITDFGINLRKLLNYAVLNVLTNNANSSTKAIDGVKWAIENETREYGAILMGILDDGTLESDCRDEIVEFTKLGYSALAINLEKCGRPLDAAEIYEKKLKMYDKARLLRDN